MAVPVQSSGNDQLVQNILEELNRIEANSEKFVVEMQTENKIFEDSVQQHLAKNEKIKNEIKKINHYCMRTIQICVIVTAAFALNKLIKDLT